VRVRVIVDDLLIDAPDRTLLALARHPNVAIRIYNPKHTVGTPAHQRLINVATDFRGALVLGVKDMRASFERFRADERAVPVERRFDGLGLHKKRVTLDDAAAQRVWSELRAFAADPANFAPEICNAIALLPARFREIADALRWAAPQPTASFSATPVSASLAGSKCARSAISFFAAMKSFGLFTQSIASSSRSRR
jgi:putative cardiolipin synthase